MEAEPAALKATRRVLYHLEPEDAARLIGHVMKSEGGEEAARELLRVPRDAATPRAVSPGTLPARINGKRPVAEIASARKARMGGWEDDDDDHQERQADRRPRRLGAPGGTQAERPMG